MQKVSLVLVSVAVMLGLTGCVLRTDFDPERLAELHWITPPATEPAEELVISQPIATPDATAVAIDAEEAPQVACDIKVNVTGGEKIYHLPGMAYYDRVKIDMSQGEDYVCSEDEAIAAGARKSTR